MQTETDDGRADAVVLEVVEMRSIPSAPRQRRDRYQQGAEAVQRAPSLGPSLFIPGGAELAAAEPPIRDLWDASLEFTPNVLGPQGFERSALTGRYVDGATEADFVAFSHRSRWGRVPVALGLVVLVIVSLFSPKASSTGFDTAKDGIGTILASAAMLYLVAGCVLTSAGVADRLPLCVRERVLTVRVRSGWASTLLATACVYNAVVWALLWRHDRRRTWLVDAPGLDHPVTLTVTPENIGAFLYAFALTCRLVVFVPTAVAACATVVAASLLGSAVMWDAPAMAVNTATTYLVPGLMIAAWEQQQRAHFRARASAAWQAGRGVALVGLMRRVLARSEAAVATAELGGGDEVARAEAAALASVASARDVEHAVVAFRVGQPPIASAAQMLWLKATLVGSVERASAAMGLRAVRFGSCGGSVTVAVTEEPGIGADAWGAGVRAVAAAPSMGAQGVLLARAVQRDFSRHVHLRAPEWMYGVEPPGVAVGVATVVAPAVLTGSEAAAGVACCAARVREAGLAAWLLARVAPEGAITGSEALGAEAAVAGAFEVRASGAGRCVVGLPRTPAAAELCNDVHARVARAFADGGDEGPWLSAGGDGAGEEEAVDIEMVATVPSRDGAAEAGEDGSDSVGGDGGDGGAFFSPVDGSRGSPGLSSGAAVEGADGSFRAGASAYRGSDGGRREARPSVAQAAATAEAELMAADRDAAVAMSWACPYGLAFEEPEAEAAYRASENAGALRHSVVATSAWVNVALAALYAWNGAGQPGAATWGCVAAAMVATVLQWAVLRPVQPGQTRWAVVTVVLYPLQSAALVAALHFHPDARNPAKLHQSWLTFVAAHMYIVALPTCVPFFAALLVIAPTYGLTLAWGAGASAPDDGSLRILFEAYSVAGALVFYCFLVNAVRYRARAQFADDLLSQRSSARWADARAEFHERLSSVMPSGVAERVVQQLTAGVGMGTSHETQPADDATARSGDSLAGNVRARQPAGQTRPPAMTVASAAPQTQVVVEEASVLLIQLVIGSERSSWARGGIAASASSLLSLQLRPSASHHACPPAEAPDFGVAVPQAAASEAMPAAATPTPTTTTAHDGLVELIEPPRHAATVLSFSPSPAAPLTTMDRRPVPNDGGAAAAAAAAGPPHNSRSAALHVPGLAQAHSAVADFLRALSTPTRGCTADLFVSGHGAASWIVVGGLCDAGAGAAGDPTSPSAYDALLKLANDVAHLPEAAAVGVRVGLGVGAVAGDLIGDATCRYEVVGPAVDAAERSLMRD